MASPDTDDVRLPAAGLPLTAFEEHMLVDDRPSHPMVIVSRFDFSGTPPTAAIASAFTDVIRREPLLAARVSRPRFGRPRWVTGPVPQLHRSTATRPPEPGSASLPRLDPETGPVVHAEIIEHPAGWSLVLAVHHAACDGLGLVAFVERWLLAAVGVASRRPRPAADVLASLRGRGRVAATWREFVRLLPRLRVGIAGIRQFVSRRVVRLGAGTDAQPAADSADWRPELVVAELDAGVLAGLEASALADGVMVNDVLAAAFIAAVDEMAAAADRPAAAERWIRLGVPMSLRTKSDHALPAANRVSMVFLDRQADQCRDDRGLVAGIHAEMELIRSHALGHIFPLSLEAGRLLPGGLARTTESPEPQATAVLSNLGRCFHRSALADAAGGLRVGEGRLESWWIVPPVRPGTALAAATHETAGRRVIAIHVDTAAMPRAAATAILGRMVERLREVAGSSSTAARGVLEAAAS